MSMERRPAFAPGSEMSSYGRSLRGAQNHAQAEPTSQPPWRRGTRPHLLSVQPGKRVLASREDPAMPIPGPDHQITLEPATRRWRAYFNNHVIADTNDALV